jgi:hypothetical protein
MKTCKKCRHLWEERTLTVGGGYKSSKYCFYPVPRALNYCPPLVYLDGAYLFNAEECLCFDEVTND